MNSGQQEKNKRLVQNEVYCCVSTETEYILKKSYEDSDAPYSYEDIENMYHYEQAREEAENYLKEEEEGQIIKKWLDENGFKELYELNTEELKEMWDECDLDIAIGDIHDYEEPQEVYEWWICSEWLIEKLREQGEPVIAHANLWGRCTTGQAILLDGVITKIQKETKYMNG